MTHPLPTYLALTVSVLALSLYGLTFARRVSPSVRPELSAIPADRAVELFWTIGGSATDTPQWEYRRRLSDGPYEQWQSVLPTSGVDPHHRVSELTNGLVYIFQVRRAGETRQDEWSNQLAVVPIAPRSTTSTKTGLCNGGALGEIRFAFDSREVDLDFWQNRANLASVVRTLRSNESIQRVLVIGQASARGAASYNLDLSEDRANSILEYLRDRADVALVASAMGEAHEEWVSDRSHERYQRVVVKSCLSEAGE